MTTILEQQVTDFLTTELGRAPTAEEIANGMISPWTLGNIHNTLSVPTSNLTISPGDNIQDAIDEISLNGGGTVLLSVGTYNVDYNINIPSDVYLSGSSRSATIIDFGGGAYSVQAIGTALDPVMNISIKTFTIQNSSSSGLKLNYVSASDIQGVDIYNCLIGHEWDNVESTGIIGVGTFCSNNGTNIKISNTDSFSIYFSTVTDSTSGHGLELVNSTSATIFDSGFLTSAGDGINMTNCSAIGIVSIICDGNTGNGINFVSDCSGIQSYGTGYINNGAYGINVADPTDNNIIFTGNYTSGNSSGAINDLGTGTLSSALVNNFA